MATEQADIERQIAEKKAKLAELKSRRDQRLVKPSTGPPPSPQPVQSNNALDLTIRPTSPSPASPALVPIVTVTAPPRRQTVLTSTPGPSVDIDSEEVLKFDAAVQVSIIGPEQEAKEKENLKEFEDMRKYEKKLQKQMGELTTKKNKREVEKKQEEDRNREIRAKRMSQAEERQLMETPGFQQWFGRASLMVERALSQNVHSDITADYATGEEVKEKDKSVKEKVKAWVLGDSAGSMTGSVSTSSSLLGNSKSSLNTNRAVTAVGWSPKYHELVMAAYAAQEDALSADPEGLVLVWSLHMPHRPEFVFTASSSVVSAVWHPANPRLIYGGTLSGQVVMWDTRDKSQPVLRSSLSSGHTSPVYGLLLLPSVQGNQHLVSVSSDGQLFMWNEGDLSKCTAEIPLRHGRENSEEVTVSCIDVPSREINSVVLGADDGHLYKARLFDRPGVYEEIPAPSQNQQQQQQQGGIGGIGGIGGGGVQDLVTNYHHAPITNLHFHPLSKHSPSNVADFFLTASYDWTCKLWSNKLSRPLMTFESAREYVLDVQWSPIHPALFAAGDALGYIHLWNINIDTEIPYRLINVNSQRRNLLLPNAPSATPSATTSSSTASAASAAASGPAPVIGGPSLEEEETASRAPAVSRLRWSDDGNMICAGTSRGLLYVYDLPTRITQPDKDDATNFVNKTMKNRGTK